MASNIKIAVIVGTGKAGKYLVNQLIIKKYNFNILVRNPNHFTINTPLANVITGNVNDPEIVQKLLKGCDVVISTLGIGIPPSERTIFSTATTNVLKTMSKYGIGRYIVITGLNVDTPADDKGTVTKAGTSWMYENYPISTRDRQDEYEMLTESDTNWTLVRLPIIEQTDAAGQIAVSLTDCLGTTISATSLANFLISQISDTAYIKQAPFIANK